MFSIFFYIFESVLLFYITFNVCYIAIFSISGIFYKKTNFANIEPNKFNKFAILIPAYKHDEVILNTVGHCLHQNYPTEKFDVVIIADSLKQLTIAELLVMPIKLIPVQFDVSTKAKSLNTALAILPDDIYDYCLVLDVDNIMEQDFLKKINLRLQNDEVILQAHRTAKNLDTPFAILDGISEEINNHIFRKGHIALGITSALSGSGQAMKFSFFKQAMMDIHSPVEDKELELFLVRNQVKVIYENDALVFDEKVQDAKVFSNQRRRWVASQFFDFNAILLDGLASLILKGNIDFFDKAIQRIILPRILLLGLTFFTSFLIWVPFSVFGVFFLGLFFLCCLSYLIAIPSSYFNYNTLKAAMRIPQAFLLMLYAMAKSRGATKKFIHTDHTSTLNHPSNSTIHNS